MPDYNSQVREKLDKQIEKLERQKANAEQQEIYNAYIKALKDLNNATSEQYQPDSFGLAKRLDRGSLDKFKSLYEKCGVTGEELIEKLDRNGNEEILGTISEIQEIISADIRALNSVNMKSLDEGRISMQRLMDNARIRTVDISDENLGTIGAVQSSRIPFNYVDPNGNEMPGVFTEKKIFDIGAGFENLMDEMQKKFPDEAHFYKDLTKTIGKSIINEAKLQNKKLSKGDVALNVMRSLYEKKDEYSDEKVRRHITEDSITDMFSEVMDPIEYDSFDDSLKTARGSQALKFFQSRISSYATTCNINTISARISDKSRIDSRNSAMSSVADLLGVPDLICRAVPMKVIREGKETEGTFMSMAQGVDIASPPSHCKKYDRNSNVFRQTNGLKDVADIQIVDFICGNIDRHTGNMFYQFDSKDSKAEKHKFTGIQGIDNDSSFGVYVPKDSRQAENRLPALCDMKVISESMMKKVMGTNKEMLTVLLRNQGLKKSQIDASCARLEMLKNYIVASSERYKNPKPREQLMLDKDADFVLPDTIKVVKDDEFNRLNLYKLGDLQAGRTNTFSIVQSFHSCVTRSLQSNPHKQALEPKKVQDNTMFRLTDKNIAQADSWLKGGEKVTNWRGTSDNFKKIAESIEKYKTFCNHNKGVVLSEDLYKIRCSLLKGISDAAKNYTDNKQKQLAEAGKTANGYEDKRIKYAQNLSKMTTELSQQDYFEAATQGMTADEKQRYADGMHAYADRALDDFNEEMRRMAEEIAAKQAENPSLNEPVKNAGTVASAPTL